MRHWVPKLAQQLDRLPYRSIHLRIDTASHANEQCAEVPQSATSFNRSHGGIDAFGPRYVEFERRKLYEG